MPLRNPLIQQEQLFSYFQLHTSSFPKSMKAESSASQKLNCYCFGYYFAVLLWKKITCQVATLQILSEDSKYWIKKYMSHLQKKRPKISKEVTRFLIYLPRKWNHLIHLAQKDLEENTALSCGIWQSDERH